MLAVIYQILVAYTTLTFDKCHITEGTKLSSLLDKFRIRVEKVASQTRKIKKRYAQNTVFT